MPLTLYKPILTPFPKWAEDSINEIGDLTVSDVWGQAQIEGMGRVIGGLGICRIHRGSLNSTKVWLFRSLIVTVTDRIKLGNRRGDSHALTIQWVHVGDPLHVHTHYYALPLGNA
jgi:hypothetical protein